MARKAINKETIKKNVIANMKKLGVYKAEYNDVIDVYSEIKEQYERLTKEFEKSGYAYEVGTGAEGVKKSPLITTLESLRKDILQYSDRLCLNPKANQDKMTEKKKKSTLATALARLENG